MTEMTEMAEVKKLYVIYHFPCFDGFTSAWVAKRFFGDAAAYIPQTYGQGLGPNRNDDDPGFEKDSHLLFVDWAPKPALLNKIKNDYMITIVDHHVSAYEEHGKPKWCEARGNVVFSFNTEKSGAMLMWEHCRGSEPPPLIIQYVQDRDLWKFQIPNSREVHAFMGCFPWTFEAWDEIYEHLEDPDLHEKFVDNGVGVLQYQKMTVQNLLEGVRLYHVGGYLVPVVNAPKQFGSELAHELLNRFPDAKFAAYYWDRGDGLREWGLRSNDDFDVSEIARMYGGGGHKTASGFQVSYSDDLNLKHRVGIKLG